MTDQLERVRTALADRYRIERELGRGAMATVYVAEDLKHHRKVAVKVLRPELAAALGADRFHLEIEIAANLTHPHILPLYDSGDADGLLYYVMPYAEGQSLRDRLAKEGGLPIAEAVRILRDVVDALDHAHKHGVVHRDIKPDNVLLSERHALVTDFGVAKAVSEATGAEKLTTEGVTLGTPSYMSPEQAAADPRIDHRADIYAFGVLAYELLTGRTPFLGTTPQMILSAQMTDTPEPVSRYRESAPAELQQLVMKCLEKKPADRWQSAEELLPQLEGLATPSGGTTPAIEKSASARMLNLRPKTKSIALAIVGAGAAALAVAAAIWQPWRSGDPRATLGSGTLGVASVAVIPFDDIGAQAAAANLSEGITEEITAQLARVRELKVISRTSAEAISAASLTLPQIADTLGVRHILEGSVQQSGNRIRVTVQLIDAQTDAHLWTDSYDRELTDLFSLQQDIASKVSNALVSAVAGPRPATPGSRTDQPAAYEAFLRGKSQLHRRTQKGLRTAIQAFQRSLSLDSGYAPAYTGLATAYALSITYGHPDLDGYQLYGRAMVMANRAIALDSNSGEAFAVRGYLATKALGPADHVGSDFGRALDLAPNSADAHGWYAHFLSREERHEQGLAEAEAAIAIDPLAPGRRVGFALDALAARRYDLVRREAQRALALEPSLALPRMLQAIASLLTGRPEHCVELVRSLYPALWAMCQHSQGQTAEAAQVIDSLRITLDTAHSKAATHADMVAYRDIATYYAWIGNGEQALSWLERAFAFSHNAVDFRVVASGLFDNVHNDRRFRSGFEELRRQMGERLRQEQLDFGIE